MKQFTYALSTVVIVIASRSSLVGVLDGTNVIVSKETSSSWRFMIVAERRVVLNSVESAIPLDEAVMLTVAFEVEEVERNRLNANASSQAVDQQNETMYLPLNWKNNWGIILLDIEEGPVVEIVALSAESCLLSESKPVEHQQHDTIPRLTRRRHRTVD
jgi:hypothetical protein